MALLIIRQISTFNYKSKESRTFNLYVMWFFFHQLKLEICELREKVANREHREFQKADQDAQSQLVVQNLLEKVAYLENTLKDEKLEKENVIQEIVNLQDVLKNKEEEIHNAEENLASLQDALSKEQDDRELLGEKARAKLQEHEAKERELDLKVKELNGEVERWKKEVDMHVEAESRLMENRPAEGEVTVEPPPRLQEQTPPQGIA